MAIRGSQRGTLVSFGSYAAIDLKQTGEEGVARVGACAAATKPFADASSPPAVFLYSTGDLENCGVAPLTESNYQDLIAGIGFFQSVHQH